MKPIILVEFFFFISLAHLSCFEGANAEDNAEMCLAESPKEDNGQPSRQKRQVPFSYSFVDPMEKQHRDAQSRYVKLMMAKKALETTKKPARKRTLGKSKSRAIKKNKWFNFNKDKEGPWYERAGEDPEIIEAEPSSKEYKDVKNLTSMSMVELVSIVVKTVVAPIQPVAKIAANVTVTKYKSDTDNKEKTMEDIEKHISTAIKNKFRDLIVKYFEEKVKTSPSQTDDIDESLKNNKAFQDKIVLSLTAFNKIDVDPQYLVNKPKADIIKGIASSLAEAGARVIVEIVGKKTMKESEQGETKEEIDKLKKEIEEEILKDLKTERRHRQGTNARRNQQYKKKLMKKGVIKKDTPAFIANFVAETYEVVEKDITILGEKTLTIVTKKIVTKIISENLKDMVSTEIIDSVKSGIKEGGNAWEENQPTTVEILKPAIAFLTEKLAASAEKIVLAVAEPIVEYESSLSKNVDDIIETTSKLDLTDPKESDILESWLDVILELFIVSVASSLKEKLTKEPGSLNNKMSNMLNTAIEESLEDGDKTSDGNTDWFISKMGDTFNNIIEKIYYEHIYEEAGKIIKAAEGLTDDNVDNDENDENNDNDQLKNEKSEINFPNIDCSNKEEWINDPELRGIKIYENVNLDSNEVPDPVDPPPAKDMWKGCNDMAGPRDVDALPNEQLRIEKNVFKRFYRYE